MARATEVDIAVAFINAPGMRLLMPDLLAALVRPQAPHPPDPARRIRVLTSDYLDVTDAEALRLLVADSYRSYTGGSPMSGVFSV